MKFNRIYKIVEEKKPSEDFTRWYPMYKIKNTEIDIDSSWHQVSFIKGYYKTKEEAQTAIDTFEKQSLESEGVYIVGEHDYKPQI